MCVRNKSIKANISIFCYMNLQPSSSLNTETNLRNITPAKYSTPCPQMTEPFSTHSLTAMAMISFLLSLVRAGRAFSCITYSSLEITNSR